MPTMRRTVSVAERPRASPLWLLGVTTEEDQDCPPTGSDPPRRIGFKPLGEADVVRTVTLVEAALAGFDLDGYSIASSTKHSNITVQLIWQ